MSFHSSKAYHVAIVVSDLEAPHHMTDLSWVAEISSVKVKLDGSHPHPPAYILMDWLVGTANSDENIFGSHFNVNQVARYYIWWRRRRRQAAVAAAAALAASAVAWHFLQRPQR